MKIEYKNRLKFLIAILGVSLMMVSCEHQEIADANYPDQLIYMPAANYNPYKIDAVPETRGSSPTPGYPVRFLTDNVMRKFNVLLGVYRSGIDNKGSFKINISANTDTVTNLIASGGLPAGTQLLPNKEYTMVSSVMMNNGEELAKFELSINLDFLLTNYPGGKFALGIGISSTDRETNPNLETTIVLVDTKIMKPTAVFNSSADASNSKKINFANTSVNGVSYLWNFGDGSATSSEKNPSHIYSSSGNYTVTLDAIGVTDTPDKSVFTKVVTVL
jgi:hypothetical protein